MIPALRISYSPARYSRSGRLSSSAGSISTAQGGWKLPTRFLPLTRFTPVFPPIEASTWASSVVGTWSTGIPRMKMAARKPAMSLTMPPPKAIAALERSPPSCTMRSARSSTGWSRLCSSPPGKNRISWGTPPSARSSSGPLWPHTSSVETTNSLPALGGSQATVCARMPRSTTAE